MTKGQIDDPRLRDIPERTRDVMRRLLISNPELHKNAPKPDTGKGRAQWQRREREAAMASRGT